MTSVEKQTHNDSLTPIIRSSSTCDLEGFIGAGVVAAMATGTRGV